MQDGEINNIDPLKPEEAAAAWQKHCPQVVTNILRILKKRMGFSKSLGRLIEKLKAAGFHVPTFERIRLALAKDLKWQTDVFERVEKDFRKAVANGKVDRNHVGGWLYCATKRKTWKLATSRAKQLIQELPACAHQGTEVLENIGTTEYSPDELLALREFTEHYAQVIAALSIEDSQLFDAKIAGKGYEDLAVLRGKTPDAIKTEVSRLCLRIREAVGDHDNSETKLTRWREGRMRS